MSALIEGRIRINLPKTARGWKLDDPHNHMLSHCMSSVDFVIDYQQEVYFIEIKDPLAARPHNQAERHEFMTKFLAGNLDHEFIKKYRDSFLYEFGMGRFTRPAKYLILINDDSLDTPSLMTRQDNLKRNLPVNVPAKLAWRNPFIRDCVVLNVKSWNKHVPQFAVTVL